MGLKPIMHHGSLVVHLYGGHSEVPAQNRAGRKAVESCMPSIRPVAYEEEVFLPWTVWTMLAPLSKTYHGQSDTHKLGAYGGVNPDIAETSSERWNER